MKKDEGGAILLMVLMILALVAILAELIVHVAERDVASLVSNRAALSRNLLFQSALAALGARLPASDLPENGLQLGISLPGGRVNVRIFSADGLINANFTKASELIDLFLEFNATPAEANRLALAIINARASRKKIAFHNMNDVEQLFTSDPDLWQKIEPFFTVLGTRDSINPSEAPQALGQIAAAESNTGPDLTGPAENQVNGFYEIWLSIEDLNLDASDPAGKLWTRVSALAGADHHLHIVAISWPKPMNEVD